MCPCNLQVELLCQHGAHHEDTGQAAPPPISPHTTPLWPFLPLMLPPTPHTARFPPFDLPSLMLPLCAESSYWVYA